MQPFLITLQVLLMNWYIAKIVFNINSDSTGKKQFDEQLRLINADTDNGGEDLYWADATTGAKTFTDLGVDQQPGQYAWAEAGGPEGATLVGIATDVSDFYLLV